jgi:hypothetical protein
MHIHRSVEWSLHTTCVQQHSTRTITPAHHHICVAAVLCCCHVLLLIFAAAAGERCTHLRLTHLTCCRHLAAAWINSRLKSSATPPAAPAAAAAARATWLQRQQLVLAQQRQQSCLSVSQLWCQLGCVEHSRADGVTVTQTASVWGNVAVCMCVTCWFMSRGGYFAFPPVVPSAAVTSGSALAKIKSTVTCPCWPAHEAAGSLGRRHGFRCVAVDPPACSKKKRC